MLVHSETESLKREYLRKLYRTVFNCTLDRVIDVLKLHSALKWRTSISVHNPTDRKRYFYLKYKKIYEKY